MELTLRQQAEQYLGAEISPSEWDKAEASAERKLERIIEREGDYGGERRKPYYLAQLIAEAVRQSRLTRFTLELAELVHYDEPTGVKKGQPVH